MLITDSALSFVLSRHPKVFKETIVYVFTTENEFQIYDDNLSVKKCEFQYDDKVQYEKFYKKLFSFVKSVNPDIILRTTPAYLWGADELLPRIVYELGSTIKIKCYQEYYSVGNALNNNEHPIASVGISNIAVTNSLAAEEQISFGRKAFPVGWLSHSQFLERIDHLDITRSNIRSHFNIRADETVIQFCKINTGNLNDDLIHFRYFIDAINLISDKIRVFIKFHPRDTIHEKNAYWEYTKNSKFVIEEIIDSLGYFETIVFPDIIISTCSAMNIDALACEAMYMNRYKNKIEPFIYSIYIYDETTKRVFNSSLGKDIIPTHYNNSGNLIANASNLAYFIKKVIKKGIDVDKFTNEILKNYLFSKSSIDKFIKYSNEK